MKKAEDLLQELYEKWSRHPRIFFATSLLAALNAFGDERLEAAARLAGGHTQDAIRALKADPMADRKP